MKALRDFGLSIARALRRWTDSDLPEFLPARIAAMAERKTWTLGPFEVPKGATVTITKQGFGSAFYRPEAGNGLRKRGSVSEKPRTILQEAIEITESHRPDEYGHPLDHFSRTIGAINAQFTETVRRRLAAGKPMFEPEDWPLFMVIDKVSRAVNAHKRDNATDIAGYAHTHELVFEERARRSAEKA